MNAITGDKTKKYGLQLRGPPSALRKPIPLKKPSIFEEDGEEDEDVEEAIARQAFKKKSLQDVELQHKRALEQDPTIFDYDAVYDDMKGKSAGLVKEDSAHKKPKYITKLLEKAKVRQQEHDIVYERQLAKERAQEDHLYGDKEKFVTSAYKKKLAEQAKWLEEERRREMREAAEEVTKRSDMSDFYRNLLSKNVAFGGERNKLQDKDAAMQESGELQQNKNGGEQESKSPGSKLHTEQSSKAQAFHKEAHKRASRTNEEETPDSNVSVGPESDERSVEPIQAVPRTEKSEIATDKQEEDLGRLNIVKVEHKPSVDALAAAKERYLARKRTRES